LLVAMNHSKNPLHPSGDAGISVWDRNQQGYWFRTYMDVSTVCLRQKYL